MFVSSVSFFAFAYICLSREIFSLASSYICLFVRLFLSCFIFLFVCLSVGFVFPSQFVSLCSALCVFPSPLLSCGECETVRATFRRDGGDCVIVRATFRRDGLIECTKYARVSLVYETLLRSQYK